MTLSHGLGTLSAKQHEFLQFLIDRTRETGVWPTSREIIDHFGYGSPNSVTQNLKALHRKGHLTRDDQGHQLAPRYEEQEEPGIPVKGIISAGTLQDAVEADLGTIPLYRLFSDLDEIFVIRVSGQPMRGADIHDGDYVLLIDEVISEEGIGAMLCNGETSLRRVCHDEDGLRLEPCNPEYDDIHIQPDVLEEVTIFGRYGGHVNEDGIYKKGHGGGPVAAA